MTTSASPSVDATASQPETRTDGRPASRSGGLVNLALRLVPAAIMGQTLAFKFSAAAEPVWIFTQLGVEPWGRLATASFETLAVALLLIPRLSALGSALTVALMAGAVGSHLTVLGIEVQGDGGALFAMACVALGLSYVAAWRQRAELPLVGKLLGD